MCLLSSDGRSNALRHTSHGNSVRSPRNGLGFTEVALRTVAFTLWSSNAVSPDSELAEDDSPDNDLRSSVSSPLGGEDADDADDVPNVLDNSDMDRSSGESGIEKNDRKKFNEKRDRGLANDWKTSIACAQRA